MRRFEDKVVIVTGAGGSIGSAIARAFAADGARVAVLDIDADAAGRTASRLEENGTARAFACDITKTAEVKDTVAAVADWGGGIDVLVNNAGGISDALFHKMTEADWDRILDLTLKGSFLMTHACLDALKAARGRVVNIGSMSYRGNVGQANYATAKAGLVGFTRSLALELARFGVTVNLVAPGLVEGPSLDALGEDVQARLNRIIPIGRPATGAEIAHAVTFFAAAEAAPITRQVLHVSGGHEGF